MEREPSMDISPAAPSTDMTAREVAVNSEPAVEISPVAATDTTTEEVDVDSEPAAKIITAAPPTAAMLSVTTQPAIYTGESVQVDGDGQHDDDGDDYEKEEMDGTEDPMDFSDKKCLSTQVIKQMNNEISTEETEGVDGLQDYQMDDGNQKRGLQNKQCLRARLSSLMAIRVFRQRTKEGRLVPRLG